MPTGSDASSPSVPDDQMLSVDDVAKVLNVSNKYVVALADLGELGKVARTADGNRKISVAAVEALRTTQKLRGRDALRDLAAASQEGGLYKSDTRGR
jgi:hypothetical protein